MILKELIEYLEADLLLGDRELPWGLVRPDVYAYNATEIAFYESDAPVLLSEVERLQSEIASGERWVLANAAYGTSLAEEDLEEKRERLKELQEGLA